MLRKEFKTTLIIFAISLGYLRLMAFLKDEKIMPVVDYLFQFNTILLNHLSSAQYVYGLLNCYALIFFMAAFVSLQRFKLYGEKFKAKKNAVRMLRAVASKNYVKPTSWWLAGLNIFAFICLPILTVIVIQISLLGISFYAGLHFSYSISQWILTFDDDF